MRYTFDTSVVGLIRNGRPAGGEYARAETRSDGRLCKVGEPDALLASARVLTAPSASSGAVITPSVIWSGLVMISQAAITAAGGAQRTRDDGDDQRRRQPSCDVVHSLPG